MSDKLVSIELISGVEGPCICIGNRRVCGNKPWGGGTVQHKWLARREDILKALKEAKEASNEAE